MRILSQRENRLASSSLSPPPTLLSHYSMIDPRDLKRSHESHELDSSSFHRGPVSMKFPSRASQIAVFAYSIAIPTEHYLPIIVTRPRSRKRKKKKKKKKQRKPRPPDRSYYGELNDDEPPGPESIYESLNMAEYHIEIDPAIERVPVDAIAPPTRSP